MVEVFVVILRPIDWQTNNPMVSQCQQPAAKRHQVRLDIGIDDLDPNKGPFRKRSRTVRNNNAVLDLTLNNHQSLAFSLRQYITSPFRIVQSTSNSHRPPRSRCSRSSRIHSPMYFP
jgi:hypothetical protein